jgi:hypothetical protein
MEGVEERRVKTEVMIKLVDRYEDTAIMTAYNEN